MRIQIDCFKRSGKWTPEDSVEVIAEDLDSCNLWDSDQCLALFDKLKGTNYSREGQAALFIRLEEQDTTSLHFIRYMLYSTN